MIQQLIYRGTSEGYRVVAISAGLAGKGLAHNLQALSRMPAGWVGRAPIYSRAAMDGGVALMRTAVDPNGTRNHHISHIYYVPRSDLPAFSRGIPSLEAFQTSYRDTHSTDALPELAPANWVGKAGTHMELGCFSALFGKQAGLLAQLLAALSVFTQPVPSRPIKGVCVLAPGEQTAVSEAAYCAMETLLRLYPGLWMSGIGYRTLWSIPENNMQYPVFFATSDCLAKREQVLNAGYLLIDLTEGAAALSRGELPPVAEGDVRLAQALLEQSPGAANSAAEAIRAAQRQRHADAELEEQARRQREAAEQDRARKAAEAADQERIRKAAEAANQERARRAAEAAEQERIRKAAEAAEQDRIRKAAEAAGQDRIRKAAEAAEQERIRKAAEAAEQDRARKAAEAAEQDRIRKAAEAAKQDRIRKAAAQTPQPAGVSAIPATRKISGQAPAIQDDDPIELSQRFIDTLFDRLRQNKSLRSIQSMTDRVCGFLADHSPTYRLRFLDASLSRINDELGQMRDVRQREKLLTVTVYIARQCSDALLHWSALEGVPKGQGKIAARCFGSMERLRRVRVADTALRQNMDEWDILKSIFYGDIGSPENLIECLEHLNAMPAAQLKSFQRDIYVKAADSAPHVVSVRGALAQSFMTAYFYANVRFSGRGLSFDNIDGDLLLDRVPDKSVARDLFRRVAPSIEDTFDEWARG